MLCGWTDSNESQSFMLAYSIGFAFNIHILSIHVDRNRTIHISVHMTAIFREENLRNPCDFLKHRGLPYRDMSDIFGYRASLLEGPRAMTSSTDLCGLSSVRRCCHQRSWLCDTAMHRMPLTDTYIHISPFAVNVQY